MKFNKQMDNLCFLSKNLYNYCNYLIRQEFINNHKLFDNMSGKLAKENQIDFRALPSNTSQQIIRTLFKNWKSFFRTIKTNRGIVDIPLRLLNPYKYVITNA